MKLHKNPTKRNAPCPCGSGLKTKKCCLRKVQDFQRLLDAGYDADTIIVSGLLKGEPSEP